jgi:S-adenosylmethionine synthetase
VFTSESVSEGHPDKVCDQISDAILDACLAIDKKSRVACETMVTTNFVANAGEITCKGWEKINPQQIARDVVKSIGYDKEEYKFSHDTFQYVCCIHGQSPDIAQGVNATSATGKDGAEQGAGDQGMMFGYASNETPELMPATLVYSHRLLHELSKLRRAKKIAYLRPDSKSQVSIRYENGKPQSITNIVISHQTDDVDIKRIHKDLIAVAKEVLAPTKLLTKDTMFYINPTGKFVLGGPAGDSGVTGRKIIVDTYGGVGSHGGGAFSGKDPTKVDRSAAYYARYVAKNIVAAGIADKCEIQVAYAIGVAHPTSVNVSFFGTGKIEEAAMQRVLEQSGIFDFRPAQIEAALKLREPKGWNYQETASYGHFGRKQFPWEKTDKIAALRLVLKIK